MTYWYSRFLFERSLALMYLVAFTVAANQFVPLLGERGTVAAAIVWGALWLLYLSFVNVGQTFYGFGWETLLLEAGFLAIFLGGSATTPSAWLVWMYTWVLFRLMFGAGLIKLRGDPCW